MKLPRKRASAADTAAPSRPEDEWLGIGRSFTYGAQHVLTMYGGIIAPPLIVGGAAGVSPTQLGLLVASCLFIGGLAEDHVLGTDVGPTFRAIIAKQFAALRDGDRFFWLNQGFDRQTSSLISNATLATLILRNTDTTALQAKVFLPPAVSTHSKPPAPQLQVDTHGRRGVPFVNP